MHYFARKLAQHASEYTYKMWYAYYISDFWFKIEADVISSY